MAFPLDSIRRQDLERSSAGIRERIQEQRVEYQRKIEGFDYKQLSAEVNRQVGSSQWRAGMCMDVARGRGWDKGPPQPPSCWERIMGEDWC